MPIDKRPLKVFLCHARDDKVKARELYRNLRKRGIQPWLDAEDLVAGQDWRVEIPKAIKSSDAIIVCLSKNSINKKGFVQAEIKFALEKALEIPQGRIFIIPVRFENCEVPDNLERFHWVDLFEDDGFPKLMKSLKTRAGQLERSTVQVPQPDEASPNLTSALEEKVKSETAEKVAREKAKREAVKKAESQKLEQEAAEKVVREKAERESAEKVAREKAGRESAEKDERDRIAKEMLEKAEQQAAEKAAREKAEREAIEKKARDKNNELAERARLEAEKLNAKKQAGKKAIEKAPLEAGKQETSKITETDTKIKPWIAYGGAISIGLFFGILSVLVLVIPDVAGLNLSWDPFGYLLFAFYVLAGVWLVVTRRGLAFFLSYIVWFLLLSLADIVRNNYDIPLNIVLLAFFLYGFVGLVIGFFLLKISVIKKLFSKILLCCAVCVILLFIVFLGSDAMLGFIGVPVESSYGLLPYVFFYFLFCSLFGNWLRQVFKDRLVHLFAEN